MARAWSNKSHSIYTLTYGTKNVNFIWNMGPLSHQTATPPLRTYLVPYRKVLAILSAAADSAIQTFVNVTVPFIRVVSTIISAFAEAPFWDAAAIGTHEEGTVAQAS